jgi:hypothetical protein
MGQKKHCCAGARHIRSKASAPVDQIWHRRGWQNRLRVDQRQMQPDCQTGEPARELDGSRRCRRSDHQARRSEDAFDMGALNRLIDFVGEAEIVRGDDKILQCAISRRSRR